MVLGLMVLVSQPKGKNLIALLCNVMTSWLVGSVCCFSHNTQLAPQEFGEGQDGVPSIKAEVFDDPTL